MTKNSQDSWKAVTIFVGFFFLLQPMLLNTKSNSKNKFVGKKKDLLKEIIDKTKLK